MSNVPKLRFKEFSGKWEEKPLGKYGKLINGLTYSPDNIVENGLLVLRSSNIQNEQISFEDNVYVNLNVEDEYLTCENDILICVRNGSKRLIGKSLLIPKNLPKSTHGAFMTVFRGDSNKFISHWLKTPMFFKEVHKNLGATINSINGSNLKKFKTFFPNSKEEQEKIASFLTSVDTKIEQLTKKEQLLQQYKKGVMQKIFNQEMRFKDDDGSEVPEWEEKKLNKYLYEHKEKNFDKKYTKNDVLSVSGEYGIVNQIELQGRSFAGESIDNYHFVDIGDVVYTKSPLKANPYGIVKTNKKKAGVVSTLYAVYRPKENLNPLFIDYYFQLNDNVNKYFRPLVQKGAKNDMKINNSYAISDPVLFPEKKEQTKIANFLSSIDSKIEQVQKQLNSTKEFKKALLQQMFI